MKSLYEKLLAASKADQLLWNEPMSRHTTFRVGGPADLMYFPESAEQLVTALKAAQERQIPAMVMGNGSNMIVRDGGVRGLVIVLGDKSANIQTAASTDLTLDSNGVAWS